MKQTQPKDDYECKRKKLNKFATQKQTNKKENNQTKQRGQILRNSVMCLHSMVVKRANASFH